MEYTEANLVAARNRLNRLLYPEKHAAHADLSQRAITEGTLAAARENLTNLINSSTDFPVEKHPTDGIGASNYSAICGMISMDDEMAECTLNEIYELFDGARMVLEEMCIPFNVPMKELVLTESVVQIFITKLMELFGENKIVKSLLPKNKSSCSGDRDSSVVSEELAQ